MLSGGRLCSSASVETARGGRGSGRRQHQILEPCCVLQQHTLKNVSSGITRFGSEEQDRLFSVRQRVCQRNNRHANQHGCSTLGMNGLFAIDDLVGMPDCPDSRTTGRTSVVLHGKRLPATAAKPVVRNELAGSRIRKEQFHALRNYTAWVAFLLEKVPAIRDSGLAGFVHARETNAAGKPYQVTRTKVNSTLPATIHLRAWHNRKVLIRVKSVA